MLEHVLVRVLALVQLVQQQVRHQHSSGSSAHLQHSFLLSVNTHHTILWSIANHNKPIQTIQSKKKHTPKWVICTPSTFIPPITQSTTHHTITLIPSSSQPPIGWSENHTKLNQTKLNQIHCTFNTHPFYQSTRHHTRVTKTTLINPNQMKQC